MSVEEVDEETAEREKKDMEALLTAHATGKHVLSGAKDDGTWSLAEAKARAKLEDGPGVGDDPDPVDAFSTHNPWGGAYKGIHLDEDEDKVLLAPSVQAAAAAGMVVQASGSGSAVAALLLEADGGDEFKKRKRPAGIKARKKGKPGQD